VGRCSNAPNLPYLSATVDLLTVYGALAVCAMLVFYSLEARAAVFVLAFAAACAASSLYGFLQGAWPFGVVEAVWCVVALRRWWRRRATEHHARGANAVPDQECIAAGQHATPNGL
jgi:hypothetical protein